MSVVDRIWAQAVLLASVVLSGLVLSFSDTAQALGTFSGAYERAG